jgi:hypothetical protein
MKTPWTMTKQDTTKTENMVQGLLKAIEVFIEVDRSVSEFIKLSPIYSRNHGNVMSGLWDT